MPGIEETYPLLSEKIATARAGGYRDEEIQKHIQGRIRTATKAGYSVDQINAYLGDIGPTRGQKLAMGTAGDLAYGSLEAAAAPVETAMGLAGGGATALARPIVALGSNAVGLATKTITGMEPKDVERAAVGAFDEYVAPYTSYSEPQSRLAKTAVEGVSLPFTAIGEALKKAGMSEEDSRNTLELAGLALPFVLKKFHGKTTPPIGGSPEQFMADASKSIAKDYRKEAKQTARAVARGEISPDLAEQEFQKQKAVNDQLRAKFEAERSARESERRAQTPEQVALDEERAVRAALEKQKRAPVTLDETGRPQEMTIAPSSSPDQLVASALKKEAKGEPRTAEEIAALRRFGYFDKPEASMAPRPELRAERTGLIPGGYYTGEGVAHALGVNIDDLKSLVAKGIIVKNREGHYEVTPTAATEWTKGKPSKFSAAQDFEQSLQGKSADVLAGMRKNFRSDSSQWSTIGRALEEARRREDPRAARIARAQFIEDAKNILAQPAETEAAKATQEMTREKLRQLGVRPSELATPEETGVRAEKPAPPPEGSAKVPPTRIEIDSAAQKAKLAEVTAKQIEFNNVEMERLKAEIAARKPAAKSQVSRETQPETSIAERLAEAEAENARLRATTGENHAPPPDIELKKGAASEPAKSEPATAPTTTQEVWDFNERELARRQTEIEQLVQERKELERILARSGGKKITIDVSKLQAEAVRGRGAQPELSQVADAETTSTGKVGRTVAQERSRYIETFKEVAKGNTDEAAIRSGLEDMKNKIPGGPLTEGEIKSILRGVPDATKSVEAGAPAETTAQKLAKAEANNRALKEQVGKQGGETSEAPKERSKIKISKRAAEADDVAGAPAETTAQKLAKAEAENRRLKEQAPTDKIASEMLDEHVAMRRRQRITQIKSLIPKRADEAYIRAELEKIQKDIPGGPLTDWEIQDIQREAKRSRVGEQSVKTEIPPPGPEDRISFDQAVQSVIKESGVSEAVKQAEAMLWNPASQKAALPRILQSIENWTGPQAAKVKNALRAEVSAPRGGAAADLAKKMSEKSVTELLSDALNPKQLGEKGAVGPDIGPVSEGGRLAQEHSREARAELYRRIVDAAGRSGKTLDEAARDLGVNPTGLHALAWNLKIDKAIDKIGSAADGWNDLNLRAKLIGPEADIIKTRGTVTHETRAELAQRAQYPHEQTYKHWISEAEIDRNRMNFIAAADDLIKLSDAVESQTDPLTTAMADSIRGRAEGLKKVVNAEANKFKKNWAAWGRIGQAAQRPPQLPSDMILRLQELGVETEWLRKIKTRLPIDTASWRFAKKVWDEKSFAGLTPAEKHNFLPNLVNSFRLNIFGPGSPIFDLISDAAETGVQIETGLASDIVHVGRNLATGKPVTMPSMGGMVRSIRYRGLRTADPAGLTESQLAIKKGLQVLDQKLGYSFQGEPMPGSLAMGELVTLPRSLSDLKTPFQTGKWGAFTQRGNQFSAAFDTVKGTVMYGKAAVDMGFKRFNGAMTIWRDATMEADRLGLRGAADRQAFYDQYWKDLPQGALDHAVESSNAAGFTRKLSHLEEKIAKSATVQIFGEAFPRWTFQFPRWAAEMVGVNPALWKRMREGKVGAEETTRYLTRMATGVGGLYLVDRIFFNEDRSDGYFDFNSAEWVDAEGNRKRMGSMDPTATAIFIVAAIRGDWDKMTGMARYSSIPFMRFLYGEGGLLGQLTYKFIQGYRNGKINTREIGQEAKQTLNKMIPGQNLFGALKTLFDPTVREGVGANIPGISTLLDPAINLATGEELRPRQRVFGVEIPAIAGTALPGATRIMDPTAKLLSRYNLLIYRGPRAPIAGYPAGDAPEEARSQFDREFGARRDRRLQMITPAIEAMERRAAPWQTQPGGQLYEKIRKIIESHNSIAAAEARNAINAQYGTPSRLPRELTLKERRMMQE